MPLYKLLKYAYGLRDLNIFDEAVHAIESSQFYAEVEEMLYCPQTTSGFCGNEGQQGNMFTGCQIQGPLGEESAEGNALSAVDLRRKWNWQQHRKNTLHRTVT